VKCSTTIRSTRSSRRCAERALARSVFSWRRPGRAGSP
jgi:hypothetical protein